MFLFRLFQNLQSRIGMNFECIKCFFLLLGVAPLEKKVELETTFGPGGSAFSAGNTVLNVCVCTWGERGEKESLNQLRQPLLGRGRCCIVSSIQRGRKIRREEKERRDSEKK